MLLTHGDNGMQAWLIHRALLVRIGVSPGIWRSSLTPSDSSGGRSMASSEGMGSGLSLPAHYRQSLTLNKHTESWLKARGWAQTDDWEGFNCMNLCEDCEEGNITPLVPGGSVIWSRNRKQVASDGTREVSSQFIWQRLGSVTGILNSPFIFRSVLSTKGPHRSATPQNKISKEDQSQMSRGEARGWKD